ncbi:MAG TPA: ATP-binding cassette domain-containing protein [Gammaproteobacteria bacterium]|nr:ATP-binding cassette domain-containing protein [Gammaproteobacteria bacterium]
MHAPIYLKDISLSFPHKNCFENFSNTIHPGVRIAIIGRNGCGKTSLLNILSQQLQPSSGQVSISSNLCIGHVEQTIHDFKDLSGGQRLNKKISEALAKSPHLLLLDEPTNHLDQENRKSLMRMLLGYQGTLILVSHDTELLRNCIDTLWHINQNKIDEFTGSYDNYRQHVAQNKLSLEKERSLLKRKQKQYHNNLMQEQKRAKKSKTYGEKKYSHDKLALRNAQTQGQLTCNKNKRFINDCRHALSSKLSELYQPETLVPKFSISSNDMGNSNLISIHEASIGYSKENIILKDISLTVSGKERVAIYGKNASGKSTLLKAIFDRDKFFTTGQWQLPHPHQIGYLDQHYCNLDPRLSIIGHLQQLKPRWDEREIREHLNDFLFRKNEEILPLSEHLSGGEKARLSLCLIAAKTPKLLILDEITNNLDLETKEHIAQILKTYPGSMIIVSHDKDFLYSINISTEYQLKNMSIF